MKKNECTARVNRILGSKRAIERTHANILDIEGRRLVCALVRDVGSAPTKLQQQQAGYAHPVDLDNLWNKALGIAHYHPRQWGWETEPAPLKGGK